MKFRYRLENRGWFIPQYKRTDGFWTDVPLKRLGGSGSELHRIAYSLGRPKKWGGSSYNFSPNKGESEQDCPVYFETEMKCFAFLGALKLSLNQETTKEF